MLRRFTLLTVAAVGCVSHTPQSSTGLTVATEPEPEEYGPQLGSTHVIDEMRPGPGDTHSTRDTTPPPPDYLTPTPFAESRRDATELVARVHALCKHPGDHAQLVSALRALADALFVTAGNPESVAAIAEHRRVMLAELDVFRQTPPDSPAQAVRIRIMLDRAMLAITAGRPRTTADLPAYNLATAELAETVRHIDPLESPREQRPDVLASMQRAANALYAALGFNAPFRMPSPTV
jgi:hypothetical protein